MMIKPIALKNITVDSPLSIITFSPKGINKSKQQRKKSLPKSNVVDNIEKMA